MVLLALTEDKSEQAASRKENGLTRSAIEAAINAVRGGAQVDSRKPKASAKP
jgi:ATP-dependent Clp protease ATP-binding subunit ClpB